MRILKINKVAYKDCTFSDALTYVKDGYKIRLKEWTKDITINLQVPDEHSKMPDPYLYVNSRFGNVPCVLSQVELMSNDWEILEK